jgi:hypothetical protein
MLCEPLRRSAGCSEQLVASTMECWAGQCVRDRELPLRNVGLCTGTYRSLDCSADALVSVLAVANILLRGLDWRTCSCNKYAYDVGLGYVLWLGPIYARWRDHLPHMVT